MSDTERTLKVQNRSKSDTLVLCDTVPGFLFDRVVMEANNIKEAR